MEWVNYSSEKPLETGAYVVCITRPYAGGDSITKYIAYYKHDLDVWFEYDPLTETVGSKMTFRITGWAENLGVFLG